MIRHFELNKKNIIITGAAGLLGRSHAQAVAEAGGNPILIDIDMKNMKSVKTCIDKNYDVTCEIIKCDITNEKILHKISKKIMKKFNSIDGIINNAARNPKVDKKFNNFSRLENFKISEWYKDIDVGLTGAFLVSKVFGSLMSKQKNGGIIINISSDLGIIAPDQRLYRNSMRKKNNQFVKPVSYSVVKHGIIGLTKYLATYWPDKVRCNALCPGGISSNIDKTIERRITQLIPMGRMAHKDEYQGAIIFLLSSASNYMNGAILNIDGGRTAW